MTTGFGAPSAAVCAVHLDREALSTCERCGNNVCTECTDGGRFKLCEACRDRTGIGNFELTRENTDFGSVMGVSWDVFAASWVPLSLGSLVHLAVWFTMSCFSTVLQQSVQDVPALALGINLGGSFIQQVVLGFLMLGLLAMCYRALARQPPSMSELFSQGSRLLAYIVHLIAFMLLLVVPLAVVVGAPFGVFIATAPDREPLAMLLLVLALLLVALVPMLYVGLGILLGPYELVYDPSVGPIEALKRSWKIASGRRLLIFGVSFMSLVTLLAGILLFCVGLIPAQAFSFLMYATLHRGLRNGSGLPEPATRFN